AYVAGTTQSADFPTKNPLQASLLGTSNGFVFKLDSSGALVYSTYLGGRVSDSINGIAVDSTGSAYLTGSTLSGDFPTTTGAFQAPSAARAVKKPPSSAAPWSGLTGHPAVTVNQVAADPKTTTPLYPATATGVFKSTNGGTSWIARSGGLPAGMNVTT